MIAGAVYSRKGMDTLFKLLDLLYRAAKCDEYLEPIARDSKHCHGFGYVVVVAKGGARAIHYARFDAADYLENEEESCERNLELMKKGIEEIKRIIDGAEKAMFIVHARRASRGEPRGSIHAHPYVCTVHLRNKPLQLYLAHNGGVNKYELAQQLESVELDHSKYTDSNVLLIWLAEQLEQGKELIDAISDSTIYVKSGSALNLGVLVYEPEDVRLYLVGYVHPEAGKNEDRKRYYRPFIALAKEEGLIAFASSTVKDLAESKGLPLQFEEFDNRVIEIRLSEPEKIEPRPLVPNDNIRKL